MPRQLGRLYCFAHDPQRAQERAEARRRGGEARATPPAAPGPPPAHVSLRSGSDALDVLERVLADTLAQGNDRHRSRAVGYLVSVGLRAGEISALEERLARVEEALRRRGLA